MGQFATYADPEETQRNMAAFRNLVAEALALCLAADPEVGAELSRLLKMEASAATDLGDGQRPEAGLRTCLRMLIYARAEAHETLELLHWEDRLDLCIERLDERLGRISCGGTVLLHS
jgi:hypothetical protein